MEKKALIWALRQGFSADEMSFPNISWEKVLLLARHHKVSGLCYYGLKQQGEVLSHLPQEVQDGFLQDYRKTLHQGIQWESLQQDITIALQKAKIPHAFLKGACIRDVYPVKELRSMCDMDLLVLPQDHERITVAFSAIGAVEERGDGNHYNYRFPNGLCIECHPNLMHPGEVGSDILNPGWQFVQEGSTALTAEGLYLHALCHLAGHLLSGGAGVRFVLDLWLLSRNWEGECPYEAGISALGLTEFHRNILALGEYWFGAGERTDTLEELADYIFTSGSHGFAQRAALNAVSVAGSQKNAFLKRVFCPREALEARFSWVRGRPLLLPAAWLSRCALVLTSRRKELSAWKKQSGKISQGDANLQREKLIRFGLVKEKA